MFSPWMRRLSQSKVLQAQTDLKQSSHWLEEKSLVLKIIKGAIDVLSGGTHSDFQMCFTFGTVLLTLKLSCFLRTLLPVIVCRSFRREFTAPTGKEVGKVGNAKQAIELALLTQRCQDHLLRQHSAEWEAQRWNRPPAVAQEEKGKKSFWHLNVLALSDLKKLEGFLSI